ncbi:hypothetical protein FHR23_003090 [Stakelama sediminis]|uniref:Uncharacterized protein n=1 Tax=Stakelama sediminis TaxID=463200 RepID=A0A840Z298_9SPHN|nr:hypothetical protein [Stakelama sediminis]MBB5720128.1 hypothetical protein [Stakelama sediminis]
MNLGDGAWTVEIAREFAKSDGRAYAKTAHIAEQNQPPAPRPTAVLLSRHPPFPFLTLPAILRPASPSDEAGRESMIVSITDR